MVAAVGGNGMVCLFASADVEAIVDVTGYFVGAAPVDTGKNCPQEFPADTYPVGPYQMPPGRYVSEAPTNIVCEFYRWNTDNFLDGHLGSISMFGAGRLMVDVLPTDKYINFRFETCAAGAVRAADRHKQDGLRQRLPRRQSAHPPGTYQATRRPASVCTGVRLSSFDGSKRRSSAIDDTAPIVTITILPTDVGLLAGYGCTKIG